MKKNSYRQWLLSLGFVVLLGFALRAQTTYTVGEGSRVWVEGTSTLKNWKAEVQTFDGTVNVDENGQLSAVSFSFDVKSMDGGRGPDMNAKIYTALKADEAPKITFQGQKAAAEGGDLAALGTLSLAGKQMEELISVTGSLASGHLIGQKALKLSDFDIEPPSAMFGQIVCHDDLTLMFDLTLVKQSH